MSSLEYSLCSTAGLQAVTDTPDSAAASLARHLSDVGCRGVQWMITAPDGRILHGRFDPPLDRPRSMAIAEHVDAVHGRLLRNAAKLMYATSSFSR